MWARPGLKDNHAGSFVTVIETYHPNQASPSPTTTKANADKGLPELPSEHLEVPRAEESRPVSTVPTASSIYSQPSPELGNRMENSPPQISTTSSIYADDISPPDSPIDRRHGSGHSRKSSFNVSPISTEHPSPFSTRQAPAKTSPRYSSNLPVPRKNLKKFWKLPDKGTSSQDHETTAVRWDEYSGEPTTSERGKPPSTTPGAVRLNEDPTPGHLNYQNFGTSTYISGGNTIPRKRVGNRDVSDTPIILRPEWKGAGGRHTIIRPPVDKPLPVGRSPQFPMGLQKKKQIEEEQAEQARQERERIEREQAEQQRLQDERRAREQREEEERKAKAQREEDERNEARRREQERAEQARIDRERAEQDRRTRERVVQARRERDLVLQGQRGREQAAAKADLEREQAFQEAIQDVDIPRPLKISSPTSSKNPPTTPLSQTGVNRPGSKSPVYSRDTGSPDSALTQISPTNSIPQSRLLNAEDIRSPLARNPSNEEMKNKPQRPADSTDPNVKLSDTTPPSSSPQSLHWQPRASSLSGENQAVQDPSIIERRFRAEIENISLPNEPKSRFSATTCATTVLTDSPPVTPQVPSDSPVMPSPSTPDSIMNRKRPLPPAGVPNSKATARKPTPLDSPATPVDHNKLQSKSLPKAPPDAPKVPPVQTLQAKQDALRRRKRNIETVIHELTEVVQPSSIAYDMASRQEIKRTVEQLKRELSDVIREEHETGLKLHRAWKRQDNGAIYEPTSIWVRRVTT